MRESCFGSGTQGKQDCYEYHQGRTEVNMRQKKRDGIWGYIFIAPQVIGLLLFSIIPIICVFYFSFCKWDAISEPVFIGIQNYITEFHDPAFYKAIVNTLKYSLIYIPGNVVFALLIATAIQHIKGKVGYRLIFFLPIVASSVGVSMIWLWILEPNCGILNYFLECIKLGRVNLLGDTKTVMLTIGLIGIWCNLGYNVVIYIAGLEGVSRVYYEAAMVDGASAWTRFIRITLPMMSPTIFFTFIMTMIASFKVFDLAYVMTEGGPAKASYVFVMHIYDYGFKLFKMGQSCTAAVIFFMALLGMTVFQNVVSKRWVNYES